MIDMSMILFVIIIIQIKTFCKVLIGIQLKIDLGDIVYTIKQTLINLQHNSTLILDSLKYYIKK